MELEFQPSLFLEPVSNRRTRDTGLGKRTLENSLRSPKQLTFQVHSLQLAAPFARPATLLHSAVTACGPLQAWGAQTRTAPPWEPTVCQGRGSDAQTQGLGPALGCRARGAYSAWAGVALKRGEIPEQDLKAKWEGGAGEGSLYRWGQASWREMGTREGTVGTLEGTQLTPHPSWSPCPPGRWTCAFSRNSVSTLARPGSWFPLHRSIHPLGSPSTRTAPWGWMLACLVHRTWPTTGAPTVFAEQSVQHHTQDPGLGQEDKAAQRGLAAGPCTAGPALEGHRVAGTRPGMMRGPSSG